MLPELDAIHARRSRQAHGIGDLIEIFTHPQLAVVNHIDNAPRAATKDRKPCGDGQIVGVNVVGEHVIADRQRRRAGAQPLDRQTLGRVDAWRAKNCKSLVARSPHAIFGGNTSLRSRVIGARAARLVNAFARAISVDARCTHIHRTQCARMSREMRRPLNAARSYTRCATGSTRPRGSRKPASHAHIIKAICRRRRHMQHRIG